MGRSRTVTWQHSSTYTSNRFLLLTNHPLWSCKWHYLSILIPPVTVLVFLKVALKIQAACSSEMTVSIYQTSVTPEDHITLGNILISNTPVRANDSKLPF
jgi:hypothetical protein